MRVILLAATFCAVTSSIQAQITWAWSNPQPSGSSLLSVAFSDDTTATAVGNSGTIVRTTNRGLHWSIVNVDSPRFFNCITFTNAHTGIAVGDSGIIYRTTNAGISWRQQQNKFTSSLYGVSFTDSNTGIAVGGNSSAPQDAVILRTTDGGSTWNNIPGPWHNVLDFVAFSDLNNGFAGGDYGLLLHTTDGGASWSSQQSGSTQLLRAIAMHDSLHAVVVGYQTILSTSDAGSTWASKSNSQAVGISDICFTGDQTAVIVGAGITQYSTDGGSSWRDASVHGVRYLESAAFANALDGIAVGQFGAIAYTTDGGVTWSDTANLILAEVFNVAFSDSLSATAVASSNAIATTTNRGASWSLHQIELFNNVDFHGVAYVNKDTGFVVGQYGTMCKTSDGGSTWETVPLSSFDDFFDVNFSDALRGTIVGSNGTILRTTDGGERWYAQSNNVGWTVLYRVINNDSVNGTAIGQQAILHTTNGGNTWIESTYPGYYFSDIAFSCPDTGWIVGWLNTQGVLFKTTDKGVTWTDESKPEFHELSSISFVNSKVGVIVVWYGSLLLTTDGGATWSTQPEFQNTGFYCLRFWDSTLCYGVGSFSTILRGHLGELRTGLENSGGAPTDILSSPSLLPNSPNPFGLSTDIRYSLAERNHVRITVCDVLGRTITTLVDKVQSAGEAHVTWNSANAPNGIYFCKLEAGRTHVVREMVLIK